MGCTVSQASPPATSDAKVSCEESPRPCNAAVRPLSRILTPVESPRLDAVVPFSASEGSLSTSSARSVPTPRRGGARTLPTSLSAPSLDAGSGAGSNTTPQAALPGLPGTPLASYHQWFQIPIMSPPALSVERSNTSDAGSPSAAAAAATATRPTTGSMALSAIASPMAGARSAASRLSVPTAAVPPRGGRRVAGDRITMSPALSSCFLSPPNAFGSVLSNPLTPFHLGAEWDTELSGSWGHLPGDLKSSVEATLPMSTEDTPPLPFDPDGAAKALLGGSWDTLNSGPSEGLAASVVQDSDISDGCHIPAAVLAECADMALAAGAATAAGLSFTELLQPWLEPASIGGNAPQPAGPAQSTDVNARHQPNPQQQQQQQQQRPPPHPTPAQGRVVLCIPDCGPAASIVARVLLEMDRYCKAAHKRRLCTVVGVAVAAGTGALPALALADGSDLAALVEAMDALGEGLCPAAPERALRAAEGLRSHAASDRAVDGDAKAAPDVGFGGAGITLDATLRLAFSRDRCASPARGAAAAAAPPPPSGHPMRLSDGLRKGSHRVTRVALACWSPFLEAARCVDWRCSAPLWQAARLAAGGVVRLEGGETLCDAVVAVSAPEAVSKDSARLAGQSVSPALLLPGLTPRPALVCAMIVGVPGPDDGVDGDSVTEAVLEQLYGDALIAIRIPFVVPEPAPNSPPLLLDHDCASPSRSLQDAHSPQARSPAPFSFAGSFAERSASRVEAARRVALQEAAIKFVTEHRAALHGVVDCLVASAHPPEFTHCERGFAGRLALV